MSENRFLQSFSALLASAILVCGTQLLLIASQEYGRPELVPNSLMPLSTVPTSVAKPSPSVAPAPASESIDVEVTGTTETPSHPDVNHFAGDQASLLPALDQGTTASEAKTETAETKIDPPSTPLRTAEADAPPSDFVPPEEAKEAAPPQDAAEASPSEEAEKAALPPQAEEAAPSTEPTKEVAAASAPEPTAPGVEPNETPKAIGPTITVSANESAAPQVAKAEEVAAAAPSPVADDTPRLAETDPAPPIIPTTKAEPVVANVPLPTRKPSMAAAKPVAPPAEPEVQQAAAEPKPRWTPMALAPADKDTVGKPQLEPKRAESASGYNRKIWSALARHKPRAGKAGSAVVTFAIGPGGGLRSARISGSSGDSRLDQMALQTVRNAAPFPPPPNPASASYTIRIYFR
ncbi:MAG: TonB family protein [Actinomycetota bacterium]